MPSPAAPFTGDAVAHLGEAGPHPLFTLQRGLDLKSLAESVEER
jgi:hypothetical protein